MIVVLSGIHIKQITPRKIYTVNTQFSNTDGPKTVKVLRLGITKVSAHVLLKQGDGSKKFDSI